MLKRKRTDGGSVAKKKSKIGLAAISLEGELKTLRDTYKKELKVRNRSVAKLRDISRLAVSIQYFIRAADNMEGKKKNG